MRKLLIFLIIIMINCIVLCGDDREGEQMDFCFQTICFLTEPNAVKKLRNRLIFRDKLHIL